MREPTWQEQTIKVLDKPMSTEEFKARIRVICGVSEGTGRRANPCCVRKPTSKGYNPPRKEAQ